MSLCLEQASKSPLHYRHGCTIVRGEKAIGRGFNHYRPGFNGGPLKNGRSKITGEVLQQRIKQKHKSRAREEPRDSRGGGSDAYMEFSMHSEMMAIRSALSLSAHQSGALARSNVWYETPCFKLSGRGKREHRLRKEKIRRYVEKVFEVAEKSGGRIDSESFTTLGDTWRFESVASGFDQVQKRRPQRQYGGFGGGSEREEEQEKDTPCSCGSEEHRSESLSVP
jgi:hypothetical protein